MAKKNKDNYIFSPPSFVVGSGIRDPESEMEKSESGINIPDHQHGLQ
jgi:hypothetical protein